jgi:hypothetical protein
MQDDKLVELLRFYAGAEGAERLSDEMYKKLAFEARADKPSEGDITFFTREIFISEREALKHAAWMALEAKKMLEETASLEDDAQHGVNLVNKAGAVTIRTKNIVSKREKAMRWLGFIQGVLWMSGTFTLDELKEHSRRCSDDPDLRLKPGEVGCDCGGEATGPFSVKHRRGCIIPGPHNDPLEKGKK